jgi:hypothetical protein
MQTETIEKKQQVAELNDKFRQHGVGARVTRGVRAIYDCIDLIYAIRYYNAFDESNDPYGEHDFGSLLWHGSKVFWKIDYYDQELKYGLDPLDVNCKRVLTVMLASEY